MAGLVINCLIAQQVSCSNAELLNFSTAELLRSASSVSESPPWLCLPGFAHTSYLEVKVALHDSKVDCGLRHEA